MQLQLSGLKLLRAAQLNKALLGPPPGEMAMSAARTRWLQLSRRVSPLPMAARSGRRLAVLAAVTMGWALLINGCAGKAPAAMAPPSVSVVNVIERDVPISGDWVATLDGFTTAQIQP